MIAKLEVDVYNALRWFESNHVVANPAKFQVVFLGFKKSQNLLLEIKGEVIPTSNVVKLLGVIINSKLNFKSHIKALCQSHSKTERICQGC